MLQHDNDWNRILRTCIKVSVPLIPLFYIWGAQWLFSALLWLRDSWNLPFWVQPASAAVAAIISVILLFSYKTDGDRTRDTKLAFKMALPVFVLFASLLLLLYLEAVNGVFVHLVRALFLSFFYVLLGVLFSRSLVYLGLWLFALTAVIGKFYLGFSPFVLESMGGLSLIVCGWILHSVGRKYAKSAH
ncbi:Uncharacterised protein [Chlamydia abortus]|uniref:DUF2157 domain-containing protein n=1 Tax=Paenibacillus residui TaxID=629724 RepID=A0ABW3D5Q7_9BACL|nr:MULTISPECIES: hypothetical protein [Paenibacillaceae]SHE12750.1 Uncharacterised protein [Chlamydia abortus]